MNERCYACGNPPRDGDFPVMFDYYPGVWCHGTCLNSPEGRSWLEQQRKSDPGFDRFMLLQTVGLRTMCPACGKECFLSAKARGMAAGTWLACCLSCSNTTVLDGYVHPREYDALMAVEKEFLLAANAPWQVQVARLASAADMKLDSRRCSCGGSFSVAAKPRCPHCRHILLDSCFHFASWRKEV
jgi:hypothetical protein